MKKGCLTGLFLFLVLLLIVLLGFVGVMLIKGKEKPYSILSKPSVAILEIKGLLMESEEILETIKDYTEDARVKAIVVRIDSPGGGVAVSQEIYEELVKARNKGIKIIVSMGSVAASGGYYIACAADKIVANSGTLTGSIGVLAEFPNVEGLLEKAGIQFQTIKSGKYKDTGSFSRPMSEEEKKLIQELLDDVHTQFIKTVAQSRKIPEEKVREYADGRVFTGRKAIEYGFVDLEGNIEDAIEEASKMAGIVGKPHIIRKEKSRMPFFDLFDSLTKVLEVHGQRPYISLLYVMR